MKTLFRLVGGLLFLVVLVPAALVGVFLVTFDEKVFRTEMAQQVRTATGREVAFNGPIGFSLDDGVSLTLKEVKVMSPEGFREKTFFDAGEVSVAVDIPALAQRRIEVKQVKLNKAHLNLVTSASGEKNWEFKPAAAPAPALQEAPKVEAKAGTEAAPENPMDAAFKNAAAEAKATFRIEKVSVSTIGITNTNVTVVDEGKNTRQLVSIGKANIEAPMPGAFGISVTGLYQDQAFDVRAKAPEGAEALASGKETPFSTVIEYGGNRYEVDAKLARSANAITLKDMKAKLRGTDVTGNLTLATGGSVPKLSGNLDMQELNLPEFLPAADAAPKAASVQGLTYVALRPVRATSIVGKAPPSLKGFDADLKLKIAKLILPQGHALEDVRTTVDLTGGRLRLAPLLAKFQDVPYEATLDFAPSGSSATTRISLKASGVDFVRLAEALGSKSPINAKGDVFMDITGDGLSPESFRNSLRGRIEMLVGKGGIDLSGGGETALNLIKMLYPKTEASAQQNMNCAAMRFNVNGGVMQTDGLLFDSPLAAVAGEGSIDLVQDSVNLLFRHAVKDNQAGGFLNVPIRATGSLAKLSYGPDEKAVVDRATAILTGGGAVSTGVPKVDMNAPGNACLAALKNPQPIMLQQMKPQEAVKETVKQATEAYKGVRDKVKDLLKGGRSADAPAAGGQQPAANNPVDAIKGLLGR